MGGHMKTTIELSDALYRSAKELASKSQTTMRAWILISAVLALSGSSLAFAAQVSNDWIHVVERGQDDVYLYLTSIRREGNLLQARWVSNSSEPMRLRSRQMSFQKQSIFYLSTFDCVSRSFAVQEAIWHDEKFARGTGHQTNYVSSTMWRGPSDKLYKDNLNVDVLNIVCKLKL